MGKTIRNYGGKRQHDNARPYERTRERITDVDVWKDPDEDLQAQEQSFDDTENSGN
jgi:hypothetical protein